MSNYLTTNYLSRLGLYGLPQRIYSNFYVQLSPTFELMETDDAYHITGEIYDFLPESITIQLQVTLKILIITGQSTYSYFGDTATNEQPSPSQTPIPSRIGPYFAFQYDGVSFTYLLGTFYFPEDLVSSSAIAYVQDNHLSILVPKAKHQPVPIVVLP